MTILGGHHSVYVALLGTYGLLTSYSLGRLQPTVLGIVYLAVFIPSFGDGTRYHSIRDHGMR